MTDCASLSDLAAAELAALRADGITPTDADVCRINALAWGVESPDMRIALARGEGVTVGNRTLYPMTLCGQDWFDRIGCRSLDPVAALAYAMGHGHGGAWLDVSAWWYATRATRAQMVEAIAQVQAQSDGPAMPPPRKGRPPAPSLGEISAALTAVAGGSPEVWERQCSIPYCAAVLTQAAAHASGGGDSTLKDATDRATVALGWAVELIRQRHAKDNASA